MYTGIGHSLGTDYFRIADQLAGEELSYLERTRDFVDNDVLPAINGYWERAEFPWPLIEKLAKLGVVGDGIDGYGCPPMSPIATGLVHMELNRGDGSLGTFLGVQATAGSSPSASRRHNCTLSGMEVTCSCSTTPRRWPGSWPLSSAAITGPPIR